MIDFAAQEGLRSMFHKVLEVKPLPGMELLVTFSSGDTKRYDVKPLLDRWEPFRALRRKRLFERVTVDTGGYGIVWDDTLDLSCNELWEHGTEVSA